MGSLLGELRDVVPMRSLSRAEALRVAELQAMKLLEALEVAGPPVREETLASLPRIQVERLSSIPVSGSTHWAKGRWVIVLNGAEPLVRQRFSLAHELKHVLDAPFVSFLYLDRRGVTSVQRGEQAADYFAGCLLAPRMWLKVAWAAGIQTVPALARRFRVSHAAMLVRLRQVGLIEPPALWQSQLNFNTGEKPRHHGEHRRHQGGRAA